jgi:hypothetical protein
MSERYLLLSSGASCAIHPSNLCIFLNSEGDFVHICQETFNETHLTQYVPIAYESFVSQLIAFRNRYSLLPPVYIDRLCRKKSHPDVPFFVEPCRWDMSLSDDKNFSSSNSSTHVSICPFDKLIKYRGPLCVSNRDCSEGMYTVIESIFPIRRCPE